MHQKIQLSVCIPSRNRQRYFQKTIAQLLGSRRQDVEFIFADNSDDKSAMIDFMEQYKQDPRITFLPAGETVYSLVANCERACAPARGDYVCLIGDDDYIDVDLVVALARLNASESQVDVFGWSRPVYHWPTPGKTSNLFLELDPYCGFVSKEKLWQKAILWDEPGVGIPHYPFTLYHSAVSRRVLDRVRKAIDGNLFHNPAPDVDFGLKLLLFADTFVYSARPFSVAGICPEANSTCFGSIQRVKDNHVVFHRELGRDPSQDAYLKDFPFPSYLGDCVAIAQTHLWFRHTFHIDAAGWGANFALACSKVCAYWETEADYNLAVTEFEKAFSIWEKGRYLSSFKPEPYAPKPKQIAIPVWLETHVIATNQLNYYRIWLPDSLGGASTPGEFFENAKALIALPDQLNYQIGAESKLMENGWRS